MIELFTVATRLLVVIALGGLFAQLRGTGVWPRFFVALGGMVYLVYILGHPVAVLEDPARSWVHLGLALGLFGAIGGLRHDRLL